MNKFFTVTTLCVLSFAYFSCGVFKTSRQAGAEEFYYMEGLRGYHEGNYEYAERSLKQLLSINPKHDAALYYMANILFGFGKKEEALRYMQAAAQADTSNYWYQLQVAQLYKMNNQVELAIQVYEDLVIRYPKKSELYFDLANLYLNQRDIEKALLTLDEIEKFIGVSEATGFYRFNMLMMQGKSEEAKPLLEELAQLDPSPRILTLLGDMYAESGKDTLALAYYNKALFDDPDYIPAIFGQAEVYRLNQQYDLFFEKMTLFMKNDYVDVAMKVDYMDQLLQNRAFAGTFLRQVDTLFTKLYRSHRADTAVVYRYTSFLMQAGREERAVEVIKEFVQNYPENLSAWHQYLAINHYLQRWDTMYAIAKEALRYFHKQQEIMTMYGIAAWQSGKISEAVSIFESILSIAKRDKPLLTQTWSFLGDLYYAAGSPKKSFQAYEKSLQLDPDQISVLNNYAYFLSLEGKKLQKAYEMSKRTIEAEPQNATYLDTFGWILYKMDRHQEAKAIFRQVLMYGKDLSAEVLDHYAEVLFALKEFDLAFIYWDQAKHKEKNPELEKKIEERKIEMKK